MTPTDNVVVLPVLPLKNTVLFPHLFMPLTVRGLTLSGFGGIGLWLHGHIHHPFVLPLGSVIPFPVVCAGSATQTNRWAHNEYVIDGRDVTMTRRLWNPDDGRFDEAAKVKFEITGG